MPQLDNLTYLPQVFWVTLFFTLWYAISSLGIRPALLQQLNTRQLLLEQTGQEGEGASEGLTTVYGQVVQSSVGNGEGERAERSTAIENAQTSLRTAAFLVTVVQANNRDADNGAARVA